MNNFTILGIPSLKEGSKIHIKKENRGKFTEYCGGKVTQECIDKAKKSKNPTLRKRATFAENARAFKHQKGGLVLKFQKPATPIKRLDVNGLRNDPEYKKYYNWKMHDDNLALIPRVQHYNGGRLNKFGDGGLISAYEGYVNPSSTEAVIAKLALQLADPTGVSSYPDVAEAAKDLWQNPSWYNLGNLAFETVGALPMLGKVTAPYKAAKAAKLMSRLGEVSTIGKSINKATRVNRAIDIVPELIPGVRRAAEGVQDITTKYVIDPIFLRAVRLNKMDKMRDYRRANHLIDALNASNTGADLISGIEGLIE